MPWPRHFCTFHGHVGRSVVELRWRRWEMVRQMAVPVQPSSSRWRGSETDTERPKRGCGQRGVRSITPGLMRASGGGSTSALESSGRRGQVGSRKEANQRRTVRLVIEERRLTCAWEGVLIGLVEEGGQTRRWVGRAPESGERQNRGGGGIFESRQQWATCGTRAREGRKETWEGGWKSSEG